jgi:hypothetical protein
MKTTWVRFDAAGPHSFATAVTAGQVTSKSLKSWFKGLDVGGHRGVYVVTSGLKKPKPWYVGLATKQTFRAECTTPDKIKKINIALAQIGKGAPGLFFLCLGNGGKKATQPQAKCIDMLETEMIRWCFWQQPLLVNNRKKLPALQTFIPGVLRSGPGKPTPDAKRFKMVLGE